MGFTASPTNADEHFKEPTTCESFGSVLAVNDEGPALKDLHIPRACRQVTRADRVTGATSARRYLDQAFEDDEPRDAVFLNRMRELERLQE